MELLSGHNSGAAGLRRLLAADGPLLAPGCYDALSARLVEAAGFDAAYMTGFGTAAGMLGRPDVGLLTMSEMVDNTRRITAAIGLPLIADGDTGYGNAINVVRTVHEYERAGVAAIQLEDQIMPKKCGHMNNKAVVGADEAALKIAAAAAARHDPDFVIVARTDVRAIEGLDAALERGRRFADAGADVLFIEALLDEREIEVVAETFRGTPLLFNWAEGGKTPPLPYERIAEMGFKIIIFPISTMLSSVRAMQRTLAAIKEAGTPLPVLADLPTFEEFLGFIGLPEVQQLEQRFADRG